jgi:hypothetical protein
MLYFNETVDKIQLGCHNNNNNNNNNNNKPLTLNFRTELRKTQIMQETGAGDIFHNFNL